MATEKVDFNESTVKQGKSDFVSIELASEEAKSDQGGGQVVPLVDEESICK